MTCEQCGKEGLYCPDPDALGCTLSHDYRGRVQCHHCALAEDVSSALEMLDDWLGDTTPEDFDSVREIEQYFSLGNLSSMFPGESIDAAAAAAACAECIRQWEEK